MTITNPMIYECNTVSEITAAFAALTPSQNVPDGTVAFEKSSLTVQMCMSNVWNVLCKAPSALAAYFGVTLISNPILYAKSAIVSGGTAVFQLTSDGTSTGTALFPNGINEDSINMLVSDSNAIYQMSYALSNSNKTLTVTVNKTSFLLGIIQSQAAAPNGTIVKLTAWGN